MKKLLLCLVSVLTTIAWAPNVAHAQGFVFNLPGGGVITGPAGTTINGTTITSPGNLTITGSNVNLGSFNLVTPGTITISTGGSISSGFGNINNVNLSTIGGFQTAGGSISLAPGGGSISGFTQVLPPPSQPSMPTVFGIPVPFSVPQAVAGSSAAAQSATSAASTATLTSKITSTLPVSFSQATSSTILPSDAIPHHVSMPQPNSNQAATANGSISLNKLNKQNVPTLPVGP